MKNKSKTNLFSILVLLLSFTVISCSGGGSSNSKTKTPDPVECSDGFGDASRCETREQL